ncbi:MAG: tetratricopeptide repeat protein [Phycisphaerae bacterium]|nr:tetratricopeptide repeat protein [Phycisphaerae bacterium]
MAERSRNRRSRPADAPAPVAARAADAPPEEAEPPTVWDVWSRPGSKYRVRAIVLLVLNVVLFAGLGVFAFWLRSGMLFAPRMAHYWAEFWRTFQPAGDDRVSLSDLLLFPISIYDVPLQMVVLGLLLAALVSIPILVSILYRFACSIPFLLVIAFIAMMPWLALTVAGSCLLASVRPFRFSFRYASAMLGLLLVVIYFFSASRQSPVAVQELASPSDRIMFFVPWVLAIIASCVVCGVVLAIARAVNYRPGAIAPLMAAMFALPVLLFEFHVGRDELQYRLLEHRYGPNSSYFADQDVTKEFEAAIARRMRMCEGPVPSKEALEAQEDLAWQLELELTEDRQSLFALHRLAAIRACDQFLYQYPESRYAANALYIKAIATDVRVDLAAFHARRVVRFYNTFPDASSKHAWERLYRLDREDPTGLSVMALLRLSQLDARECNVVQALARLDELLKLGERLEPLATQPARSPGTISGIFTKRSATRALRVPLEAAVFEAVRLRDLLRSNAPPPAGDPLYGMEPVCGPPVREPGDLPAGFLQLDPRNARYAENLHALKTRYPHAQLMDNLDLEIAKSEADVEKRIEQLEACVDSPQARDALPEALFRLGEACQEAGRMAEARNAFQRIVTEFDESIWARRAGERIRRLPG